MRASERDTVPSNGFRFFKCRCRSAAGVKRNLEPDLHCYFMLTAPPTIEAFRTLVLRENGLPAGNIRQVNIFQSLRTGLRQDGCLPQILSADEPARRGIAEL